MTLGVFRCSPKVLHAAFLSLCVEYSKAPDNLQSPEPQVLGVQVLLPTLPSGSTPSLSDEG